ncbi:MAG: GNAT family N-acetyltransferase [Bacteroides sp.]|nr:GNAT family N-acetyltransferase [Bacteroides sp.]
MTIRNLENTDTATVVQAFGKAFADYDIKFSEMQVRSMLKRRGYNPSLSFAAFDGNRIAAFTLNGTGSHCGIPTAYDTGTGTLKEYRGCGLASEILEHALPRLKEAGIRQYLLEVLKNNGKAISIYGKAGFRTIREFDCYAQRKSGIGFPSANPSCATGIRHISIAELQATSTFQDFTPSWQNSLDSISRAGNEVTMLGTSINGEIAGYIAFEPASGDIAQIAVKPEYRRQGIATALLHDAMKEIPGETVKVLNIDSRCSSMKAFLDSRNIPLASQQLEMILDIDKKQGEI